MMVMMTMSWRRTTLARWNWAINFTECQVWTKYYYIFRFSSLRFATFECCYLIRRASANITKRKSNFYSFREISSSINCFRCLNSLWMSATIVKRRRCDILRPLIYIYFNLSYFLSNDTFTARLDKFTSLIQLVTSMSTKEINDC